MEYIDNKPVVTMTEIAKVLGIDLHIVYNWRKEGLPKAVGRSSSSGTPLLFLAEEILDFIQTHPLPPGTSTSRAVTAFSQYVSLPTEKPTEERVLEQVREFLSNNRSRFIYWHEKHEFVPNQAGWRKGAGFYVFPEVFRNEVCNGLSFKDVVRILISNKYLRTEKDGTPQINLSGRRVYHIVNILGGEEIEMSVPDLIQDILREEQNQTRLLQEIALDIKKLRQRWG
jgi:hypothetical protein